MGEWIKGIKGEHITITNEARSHHTIGVHEWVTYIIPPRPAKWKPITNLKPGESHTHAWDGDIKLDTDGIDYVGASDVPGGVDINFQNVWVTLRH